MEGRLFQLDVSGYKLLWTGEWREGFFSWTSQLHLIVSHRGLLCKLKSIGVGGQSLSIVSKAVSRCLYCTPPSSFTLLETILWAIRMILSLDAFASSSDGISESEFGNIQLLLFEVAHEAQPYEDEIHGGWPVSDHCSRLW